MKLERTVTVHKPLDEVFAYLSDFSTTTEWDPGTVKTVRTTGDGAVGTEYDNTSTFAGRQTRLTYVVQELVPNERIVLRGENSTVIALDTMTFRATNGEQAEVGPAGSGGAGSTSAGSGAAGTTSAGGTSAGSTSAGSSISGSGSAISGTQVTYTADFTFKGLGKFIAPLMKPAFTKLGNEAEAGMAAALERL